MSICTCIYNIALQNTDFGVLQKSSKHFLISIFFPPGERGTPPRSLSSSPTPVRYFGSRTMSTYFLQFCSYKCVLSIFIYNIALQNTDFGVLQKSSKLFLISIFFPPGERETPPPCPTPARYFGSRTMSTYFCLQFCSYKCVLSIFIYNIALQNTDFGMLQQSSKHFLLPFSFHLGRGGHPPCPTRSLLRASNNQDLFFTML